MQVDERKIMHWEKKISSIKIMLADDFVECKSFINIFTKSLSTLICKFLTFIGDLKKETPRRSG